MKVIIQLAAGYLVFLACSVIAAIVYKGNWDIQNWDENTRSTTVVAPLFVLIAVLFLMATAAEEREKK
jgi:hypothetical protein